MKERIADPNKIYIIKNGVKISEKDVIGKFTEEMIGLDDSFHSGATDVLKCHLMVEHYLTKYLIKNNLLSDNPKTRKMFFSKKMELFKPNDDRILIYREGIVELNKVRNKYVHKLNFKVKKIHIKKIMECVKFLKPYKNPTTPIKWIELFTIRCCAGLNWDIIDIKLSY